ncbi:MAG: lipoyl(octanoyl) transferase LipB [Vicinamibacteria bacterium]
MSELCWHVDLGRRDYGEIWELQRRLVELRQRSSIPDVLLFVEHPPTYTLGRSGKREHVLEIEGDLAALGAVFVETDRGGDVTFHGPGQLVGYPILDLKRWTADVHAYLRALEEVLIVTLAGFGVSAAREPGYTGVWHPEGKLAAIGVRVSKWVTCHGFALNVTTDLDYFNHIVPCGIVGRGVSSMATVLQQPVSLDSVRKALAASFGCVFSRAMEPIAEVDVKVHAF